MKRSVKLFDRLWLPAYLLLSVSWLFAPALYHAHYGNLGVISSYESVTEPWAWVFRSFDALGAVVLGLAIWRYRLLRRDVWLGAALAFIALLSIVDVAFPMGCRRAVCTVFEAASWTLHDVESLVLGVVVGLSSLYVFWRTRSWLSVIFAAWQLAAGSVAVSGLASHEQLMFLQFVYQMSVVAWVAWLVYGFAPKLEFSKQSQRRVRRLFMWMTLFSGVSVLAVTAAHHRIFGPLIGLAALTPQISWLTQHGVISGLLLLYIARQVGKGQQRAAILLAVIMASLVAIYALYRPRPILLAFSLLLLVLLWQYSQAFGRNVGPPPLASRLRDFTAVVAGILAAACIVLTAALVTGRQHELYADVTRIYQRGTIQFARRGELLSERYEAHLRRVVDTLGVGLVVLLVWTLFRPSGRFEPVDQDDRDRAQKLLNKFSNSSEDFFKLWPHDKQYFFGHEGFVAYKTEGTVAFALADPITSAPKRSRLASEFAEFCRANGWHACFLLVPESSVAVYEPEFKLFKIGSSAVINVRQFVEETRREKWWRWQANRAQKTGYTYEALHPPYGAHLMAELRAVSDAWLGHGGRAEQGFALGYFDEAYLQGCDLHVLRDAEGKVAAFTNELPGFGRVTQRTIDLLRFRPDVEGAMSVLLMHVLQHWHHNNSAKTFDLGFVPLAKLDSTLADIARRLAAPRYSAAGLEQFKGKFEPQWHANYIAYDGDMLDLVVVLAALEGALKPDLPKNSPLPV